MEDKFDNDNEDTEVADVATTTEAQNSPVAPAVVTPFQQEVITITLKLMAEEKDATGRAVVYSVTGGSEVAFGLDRLENLPLPTQLQDALKLVRVRMNAAKADSKPIAAAPAVTVSPIKQAVPTVPTKPVGKTAVAAKPKSGGNLSLADL